jgi:ABC-type branched-subunit amino acid transport system ATPase component
VFEVRGLEKRYAGVIAVRGVGLEVRPGEIVGLIGPNGAGKTTLVNVVTGLVRATAGTVVVGDADVSRLPAHRRRRAGMSRTFQDVRLFRHLTVGENLAVAAGVARASTPPVPGILARFELLAECDRLPNELAYGVQRRVQVAQAICSRPRVVFLDEPSIGLNRVEADRMVDALRGVREDGSSLVVIDHNLDLVMSLADRILVLDHGEMLTEGTPVDVKRDRRVQEVYLGAPEGRHAVERRRGVPAPGPALLEVDDLVMRYGPVEAVAGVSLRVERGDTVAVVGPNGAGKSSLLRTIFGSTRPTSGSIRFDDSDLIGRGPHSMSREGIAYVPEQRAILTRLSVRENLDVAALGARVPTSDRIDDVFDLFPLLRERADAPAAALSGGQQQMLSIGRALMGDPKMLMLDEPSLGLAPMVVDDVYAGLARLQERGLTILLVEQNVRRALSLASRGYLMRLGRFEMDADAEAILTDDRLLAAYLGDESAGDPVD